MISLSLCVSLSLASAILVARRRYTSGHLRIPAAFRFRLDQSSTRVSSLLMVQLTLFLAVTVQAVLSDVMFGMVRCGA